jgi:uncharacterized membrane protein YbhN (UPF0104 family)
MSGTMHRTWAWARPLAGAAILAVLVWRLGAGPFLEGIRRISPWSVLAATAITAGTTLCAAWRWQTVARGLGVGLPLGTAVAASYRSQFLNSALPGGVVGDVHRGVRHGLDAGDLGRGLRAVAWERTAGQVVFAVVALAVLLVADSPVRPTVGWIAAAVGAGAVCLALLVRALDADGPSRRARVLRAARADIRHGLLDRRAWPVVTATSVVVAGGHTGVFLVAAQTTGSTASPFRLLPLAMLVLLAMVIPLSIGGWGPREGVAAWAFAAAGLGADQGVAAATAYGVLGLVATLPGALVLAVDRTGRSPALGGGAGHVEAHQDVVPGEEDRPVDQSDAVGDAVDAERPDRLHTGTDDRGRQ